MVQVLVWGARAGLSRPASASSVGMVKIRIHAAILGSFVTVGGRKGVRAVTGICIGLRVPRGGLVRGRMMRLLGGSVQERVGHRPPALTLEILEWGQRLMGRFYGWRGQLRGEVFISHIKPNGERRIWSGSVFSLSEHFDTGRRGRCPSLGARRRRVVVKSTQNEREKGKMDTFTCAAGAFSLSHSKTV